VGQGWQAGRVQQAGLVGQVQGLWVCGWVGGRVGVWVCGWAGMWVCGWVRGASEKQALRIMV
jgi:hypothetical protein